MAETEALLERLASAAGFDELSELAHGLKGSSRRATVRALLEALGRTHNCSIADTLGRVAARVKSTAPELAEQAARALLAEMDWVHAEKGESSTASAADGLGRIGLIADEAVPVLIAALSNDQGHVRASAAIALGRFKAEAAVPELIDALDDDEEVVRANTAVALGRIGVRTHAVLEALARVANNDEEQDVKDSADEAWTKLKARP